MPTPYALSSDLVSAWPAKSLEIATYLDTSLAAKTDTAMVQNAQTGTSYSYVLLDAAKLLTMNNAASNTVTVTKQATVTWVTGTQLRVMNLGAGTTTLVADTGVTINGNVALKQYQGGTLIRTASDVWLFVPTASSSGMDLITPTSVAGSGVSFSGGLVTITAASTASVNGCFTSQYDNYQIVLEGVQSTGGSVDFRLRAASVDASGANYNIQYALAVNGAMTAQANASATTIAYFGVGSTGMMVGNWLIRRPNLAQTTMFSGQGGRETYQAVGNGYHTLTTQYDGFTLIPSVGTITASLRVYGLRNS